MQASFNHLDTPCKRASTWVLLAMKHELLSDSGIGTDTFLSELFQAQEASQRMASGGPTLARIGVHSLICSKSKISMLSSGSELV